MRLSTNILRIISCINLILCMYGCHKVDDYQPDQSKVPESTDWIRWFPDFLDELEQAYNEMFGTDVDSGAVEVIQPHTAGLNHHTGRLFAEVTVKATFDYSQYVDELDKATRSVMEKYGVYLTVISFKEVDAVGSLVEENKLSVKLD